MEKVVRRNNKKYSLYKYYFIARNAPLYGLQWHPEKALAIFNPNLAIDHSIYSITAAQYVANQFLSEARQNPNRFSTRKEEEKHLIYQYTPTYIGNITETPYEQIYLFDYIDPFLMNDIVHKRKHKNKKGELKYLLEKEDIH